MVDPFKEVTVRVAVREGDWSNLSEPRAVQYLSFHNPSVNERAKDLANTLVSYSMGTALRIQAVSLYQEHCDTYHSFENTIKEMPCLTLLGT